MASWEPDEKDVRKSIREDLGLDPSRSARHQAVLAPLVTAWGAARKRVALCEEAEVEVGLAGLKRRNMARKTRGGILGRLVAVVSVFLAAAVDLMPAGCAGRGRLCGVDLGAATPCGRYPSRPGRVGHGMFDE